MDFVFSLIADYGVKVAAYLVGTLLIGLVSKHLVDKIKNGTLQGITRRAINEVYAAATEVWQVYVAAIKAAREDGKLTDEEKKRARDMAMTIAKSNLGTKGLARLARVLGLKDADTWLGTRLENAVADVKDVRGPLAMRRPSAPPLMK